MLLDADPPRGPLSALDPRGKLLAALAFGLVCASLRGLPAALLALALGAGLGLALGDARRLARRTLAFNVLIGFVCLLLPWRLDPQTLAPVFSPDGLRFAGVLAVKANAAFLAFLGLMASSRTVDLLHALGHMHVPNSLTALFFLTHRYLFVIHAEYLRLTQAMAARAFAPATTGHAYRAYANLLTTLFVRSLDRSERVWQAMLCRGFTGVFWTMEHFHWRRRDTAFLSAGVIGLAAMLVLEHTRGPWTF